MSGGGGGTSGSTTTGILYPRWAEHAIKQYFQDAIALSVTAYSEYRNEYGTTASDYNGAFPTAANFTYSGGAYAGYTYAGQDVNEVNGITAIETKAKTGPAYNNTAGTVIRKARDLVAANAAGSNLAGNTKAVDAFTAKRDAILQEFDESTLPSLAHSCNVIGRFGGSAHAFMQYREAESVARKFMEAGNDIIYSDHKSARSIMESAIANAIPLCADSIRDIEMLRLSGLYQREFAQGMYEDSHKAYLDREQMKVKRNEILGNAIRMLRGTAKTETSPFIRPSAMSEVAGLALMGMSTYAFMNHGAPKDAEVVKWREYPITNIYREGSAKDVGSTAYERARSGYDPNNQYQMTGDE